ncbi:penicillin-binding protein activator LpoB [Azonexus hydrophilus]|uniref:Penicillin-binding protein activator LpoB n=1 Tax=Azonexus hydrophilus TaxID=418702 RepID=A0A1R1I8Q3_9RHOO|nr:penicillin-binding protein activator LpoB [Azonexus hydrophilus]OMG55131.1 penicillin-binding protein activator LpoB [Azonexus hydrophilus]
MTFDQNRLLRLRNLLLASLAMILAACSTLDRGTSPELERQAVWVVLPFSNHTETPLAGQRAESIAEALLRTSGLTRVKRFPGASQQEALFEANEQKLQDEALAWARQQGARYALAGGVDEWRYKVGVDGEPAVGVTLQIIDVQSTETLWSGTGGKSGWSREALSAVAQQLIRDLLKTGLAGAR